MELRGLGVSTYVSHSCLSLDERRSAEEAFSQGSDCVIVATSTLELGIDVGDLDRVIQIDAPFTVASFLQRIGRTGRRAGSSRNCLFLATKEDAFLRSIALLELWKTGFVEPIQPPARPTHIYAQQVMALTLQEKGIIAQDIEGWIGKMPGFLKIPDKELSSVVEYMKVNGTLHSDSGVLGIGSAGERAFGKKNFMELFSVFTSPPMVKVFHGKQELGEVHQITFAVKEDGPSLLTLGGRSWKTKYIDWPRKIAYVEPTDMKGRSQWLSAAQPMHYEMCQSIAAVLMEGFSNDFLSSRSTELLGQIQEEYYWLESNKTMLLIDDDGNAIWWTFAGKLFNAAIADSLASEADKLATGNMAISFHHVYETDNLIKKIKSILAGNASDIVLTLEEDFIQELKFSECLKQSEIDKELLARYQFNKEFEAISNMAIGVMHIR
jgi:ATP-dependent Lhr-like helicase